MNWLKRLLPSIGDNNKSKEIPEGLWIKCSKCSHVLYKAELIKNQYVCIACNNHVYISARNRLKYFLDEPFEELFNNIYPKDPIEFKDQIKYKDRIKSAKAKSNEEEALIVAKGFLKKMPVIVCCFEFNFMGGSMGSVVGEKFSKAAMECINKKIPLICFSSSGGARMQEGLISLMQMAKTALAVNLIDENKIPFISVLTNPTMGGVSASFAFLGDIIIAEPHSLVGFAGPRVIEQTVKKTLPEGFQKSEFLLEHGAIDAIVHRNDLRDEIHKILSLIENGNNSS